MLNSDVLKRNGPERNACEGSLRFAAASELLPPLRALRGAIMSGRLLRRQLTGCSCARRNLSHLRRAGRRSPNSQRLLLIVHKDWSSLELLRSAPTRAPVVCLFARLCDRLCARIAPAIRMNSHLVAGERTDERGVRTNRVVRNQTKRNATQRMFRLGAPTANKFHL